MTTIAWDGKTVAGDGQSTIGDYTSPKDRKKVWRQGDIVFALAGCGALLKPMITWYNNGANPADVPKPSGDYIAELIVFSEGKCRMYRTDQPYPEMISAPDAWGSGCYFAIGAMKAGADARRAVEIASECNPHTGGAITVEDVSA